MNHCEVHTSQFCFIGTISRCDHSGANVLHALLSLRASRENPLTAPAAPVSTHYSPAAYIAACHAAVPAGPAKTP